MQHLYLGAPANLTLDAPPARRGRPAYPFRAILYLYLVFSALKVRREDDGSVHTRPRGDSSQEWFLGPAKGTWDAMDGHGTAWHEQADYFYKFCGSAYLQSYQILIPQLQCVTCHFKSFSLDQQQQTNKQSR